MEKGHPVGNHLHGFLWPRRTQCGSEKEIQQEKERERERGEPVRSLGFQSSTIKRRIDEWQIPQLDLAEFG
ncbi:hypothetical protein HPP92_020199 [Vanilla planifolia]|uniref:Uncharacterized protein n=1 Tax=Vanilla planifolia TaxID=51239 RepID=A0A835Q4M4_VANPL|nr:hypothetical protein HPP92_020199 [Vanilla planifolia]